jgi:LEA14-like dessication related protein
LKFVFVEIFFSEILFSPLDAMKVNKAIPLLIVVGGGIYAAVHFGKKALAVKALNVKLRDIKLDPINQAAITMEVINPTNYPISFNSITTDVAINGSNIATLNFQKLTQLKANDSIKINLPIKINPLEGLSFLVSFFSKKKTSGNSVTITGTVNGEGLSFPINITQNLTV